MRWIADKLGVAEQILNDWAHHRVQHRLDAILRGRPQRLPSIETQTLVRELLDERRGRIGLPFLKATFCAVPRAALKEIRNQYLHEHDGSMEHLAWTAPGRVWAADFTQPDAPIEGLYPYVLSVRDLASYCQLMFLPVHHADANTTLCALRYLFAAYGPPLVLKTDNGSHFTDDKVRRFLRRMDVVNLLSPPCTPRYNGSQEAGIGSFKTRAFHIAASFGRPHRWTCDDVEAAKMEANLQARPLGDNAPAPIHLWESRTPIPAAERIRFLDRIAAARALETQKLVEQKPGIRPATAFDSLSTLDRATVARRAIRRVLLDLGYLLVRRIAN